MSTPTVATPIPSSSSSSSSSAPTRVKGIQQQLKKAAAMHPNLKDFFGSQAEKKEEETKEEEIPKPKEKKKGSEATIGKNMIQVGQPMNPRKDRGCK